MITLIDAIELKKFQSKLTFDYSSYVNWLDDEEQDRGFRVLTTSTAKLRDPSRWNKDGREIFFENDVNIHAVALSPIIDSLTQRNFVAQHEYSCGPWLLQNHKASCEEYVEKLRRVLTSPRIEINTVAGIRVDNETTAFMKLFIPYPMRLQYRSIDLLSTHCPVIIKIGHHLSVDFVSTSYDLLQDIHSELVTKDVSCRLL